MIVRFVVTGRQRHSGMYPWSIDLEASLEHRIGRKTRRERLHKPGRERARAGVDPGDQHVAEVEVSTGHRGG